MQLNWNKIRQNDMRLCGGAVRLRECERMELPRFANDDNRMCADQYWRYNFCVTHRGYWLVRIQHLLTFDNDTLRQAWFLIEIAISNATLFTTNACSAPPFTDHSWNHGTNSPPMNSIIINTGSFWAVPFPWSVSNKLLLTSRHWSMKIEGIKPLFVIWMTETESRFCNRRWNRGRQRNPWKKQRELIVHRQDFKFAGVFKASWFYQGVFLTTRNWE